MVRAFLLVLAVAAAAATIPARAHAEEITAARLSQTQALVTRTVDELIAAPGGIAGYSVVIAAKGAPDFIVSRGVANAATGARVTPDTAFYIASQTKSYTGLLAARLDREGVLPLSTSLADVWPNLKLPAPIDARRVTLRQLLSHSAGFDNPILGWRTAYTDEVSADSYPRLLEVASKVGKPGFEYSNSGYLIYSAALKAKTGRDWKSWMQEDIFDPLGLTHTYSRSSRIPSNERAWGHQWDGKRWVLVPPKDDAIMHAAGGLFASSRDLAKWMRWQLELGKGQSDVAAADFLATHIDLTDHGLGEGEFGITCDGYSLGWSLCTYEGVEMLYHGGTYSGVRTHLFLLPQQGVGVAICANSDGMTGTLGQFFMSVIASSLLGKVDAEGRAALMISGYKEHVAKQIANRIREGAESEAEPHWGGWAWKPDAAALAAYEGVYHSDLAGDLEVRFDGKRLTASLGVMRRDLRPATPALFGARATSVELWEPVRFSNSGGRNSVEFAGKTFVREER
jgi:CubicO group peptidase (beta-lactamase class C family)